jgi:hypothetical protein
MAELLRIADDGDADDPAVLDLQGGRLQDAAAFAADEAGQAVDAGRHVPSDR